MASYRYRVETPSRYLNATINKGIGEVVVFSKPQEDDVGIAQEVLKSGGKVVTDISDPHFDKPHYLEMVKLSHHVVCATPVSRDMVYPLNNKVTVIPDPYEMALCKPHADGENLLWYGHNTNLKDLGKFRHPNLKIVTGPKAPDGTIKWSPEALELAMASSNICLLPTAKGSEYKSPNRLLNALRQGLFPMCKPHPAYNEFKKFCWVGSFHTGLTWTNHFRPILNELVLEGQEYIEKYAPEKIGGMWKELLDSI